MASLLRMLVPEFLASLPTSLAGRLGHGVELAVALTGALAVLVVALLALAAERSAQVAVSPAAQVAVRPAAQVAVRPAAQVAVRPAALRGVALLAGLLLAVTTPGGVIPAAGYTFAMAVVVGGTVFIVLTVLRRPWLGILLAVVVGGILTHAVVNLGAASIPVRLVGGYAAVLPLVSLALGHVMAASGLLVWAVTDARSAIGPVGGFVLRHRVAITVVAAACALPYALARASWLTPWPLFGGSAELFAEEPSMLVTGLMLGTGMLMGGVLTLGLVLPWGRRFPRFLAGLGGRDVPLALAVIPASIVSVLFTAAGVEFAIEGVGPAKEGLYLLLMFPFWLWGPLLGLAAWGYAMHRRQQAEVAAPIPGVPVSA
ncbi:hypothetical protein MHM582_0112 [Microbacterium sp. HM58-2]|nr:hypothetical protein MHM582_0112 [Microbacterium sp. HM58-2]